MPKSFTAERINDSVRRNISIDFSMYHLGPGGFTSLVRNPQDYREDIERYLGGRGNGAEKSYIESAEEQFAEMFGLVGAHLDITKKTVEDAMARMRIDGVPYGERYDIQVTDKNYEMVVCHIINNLTAGDIAESFNTETPMKVTVASAYSNEESMVSALLPPEPQAVSRPSPLSGWKRFWSRFGFYKRDVEQYQQSVQEYEESEERRVHYQENVRETQEYAAEQEAQLDAAIGMNPQMKERAGQVYRDRDKKTDLENASKAVLDAMPFSRSAVSAGTGKACIGSGI